MLIAQPEQTRKLRAVTSSPAAHCSRQHGVAARGHVHSQDLIVAAQEPSPEFLQQLREYTGFRMKLGAAKAYKSF